MGDLLEPAVQAMKRELLAGNYIQALPKSALGGRLVVAACGSRREIPVGRILSTARTGYGSLGELEITVLSGSGDFWAEWWRYESTLAKEGDLLAKIGKR